MQADGFLAAGAESKREANGKLLVRHDASMYRTSKVIAQPVSVWTQHSKGSVRQVRLTLARMVFAVKSDRKMDMWFAAGSREGPAQCSVRKRTRRLSNMRHPTVFADEQATLN